MLDQLVVSELKMLTDLNEKDWFARATFKNNGLMYVLSQTDSNSLNDHFMKIEVFVID